MYHHTSTLEKLVDAINGEQIFIVTLYLLSIMAITMGIIGIFNSLMKCVQQTYCLIFKLLFWVSLLVVGIFLCVSLVNTPEMESAKKHLVEKIGELVKLFHKLNIFGTVQQIFSLFFKSK